MRLEGEAFVAEVQRRAIEQLRKSRSVPVDRLSELEKLAFEAGVACGSTVTLEIMTEQMTADREARR